MANDFYNRNSSFNPDELADGDAIEAEFDSVSRGFDTIEALVNVNKAGYPTQTFHVAPATKPTHAVPKAQMDTALGLKLDAVNYNATDVLNKLKTVDGAGSGLDADLLDGQDSAYYRNASNINTGTLAKERLPGTIDASTAGNAATATQTTATAAAGATADLVKGAMGSNDFFRIRVGGNADAGWTEIATADNGNEPIYVRQYTGDFASVARELKLLDANGDTHLPGNLRAAVGGVTVKDTNCGMYPGNGDSASSTINNLKLSSLFGIGFGPSISGQPVPLGEYSHWFNVRNGDMGVRGTITAPQLKGNSSTATRLATARRINGVNFDGTANITVEDGTKLPLVGGGITGPISFTPTSGTVMSFGATPVIRRFTGANSMSMGVGGDDTLLLGAGESVGIMATNLTLGGEDVHIGADTNIFMHVSSDNWATWAGKKTFSIDATNGPLWNGGKVWNEGNDGAGSGLDADLLDGQDSAYYRNAANLNAGILPDARLSGTYTGVSITGNAATAGTLQTARTINNVSFNGGANITVEPYIETDSSSASRYLTFVDSVTAGYQRLNMDSGLTYNPSTNVLSATVTSDINEVGKVVAFAKSSAPSGFLKCNGAAVSRTTYAALYAAIGTTFGAGDGSTTFNIPDLRGEFVRGWDDARGIDSGRTFGSWQDGQNVSHTHTGTTSSDSHTHTWSGTTSSDAHTHTVTSIGTTSVNAGGGGTSETAGSSTRTTSSDSHTHTVSGTTSSDAHTHTMTTAASGGTEVRVRNRALLYCIKY